MSEPYRERPPMEGDDDVVTIAAHQTTVEAEMAREYLKDQGITAFVHEASSFNPMLNVVAGGARILVRSADAGRARSLLRRVEKTSTTDEDDGEDGEVRCPRCELTYCFHERTWGTTSSTLLLPVAPLLALASYLFASKRWRCHKCLHVWKDASEGPKRMTPLHPDDPRPVFRLRRNRAGTGLFIGLIALPFAGLLVLSAGLDRPLVVLFALVAPLVGFAIGRRSRSDVCSAPGCRATLPHGAEHCPACRGALAGTIRGANEHYSEAAEVRRELAALRAKQSAKALARRKKKGAVRHGAASAAAAS